MERTKHGAWLFFLVFMAFAAAAEDGQSPPLRDEVLAARKLVAVFDAYGLPNVGGLKLVRYNTGRLGGVSEGSGPASFIMETGWLLTETARELTLVKAGSMETFDRTEVLEAAARASVGALAPDAPQPHQYVELSVKKAFRKAPEVALDGGKTGIFELGFYAHWCFQRGLDAEGTRLAQALASDPTNPRDQSFDRYLVTIVADEVQLAAVLGAERGMKREALLRYWKGISRLPENKWRPLANEYVRVYEQEILEDEAFEDVVPEDVDGKIRYWLYKLRDDDAPQIGVPGPVDVFEAARPQSSTVIAAAELRKLGRAALPAIIEHLDDLRPTRTLHCYRAWRECYLFRYADVCQQIFEAITGKRLYDTHSTSGTLTNEHAEKKAKAVAQAWWAAHGPAKRGSDAGEAPEPPKP